MYELDRPDTCSIGRAMEILGERWTFLILRESFYGVRRFSDMQRNLGIARNILSGRLQSLVRAGILERRRYQEEPERFEYRLTEAGRDLYPAIITIMRWGDKHLVDDGPPVVLRHTCGAEAEPVLVCGHCHAPMDPRDVTPEPGPGAQPEDPAPEPVAAH
jgi:DNA-binding HxlR family transcriptional regulator